MTRIAIIAAAANRGVIGNNGELPWPTIPEDMRFFRDKTMGSVVIMGRKTFESIGRLLPKRVNIVVSRLGYPDGGDDQYPDLRIARSLDKAIEMGKTMCALYDVENIFIIGGGEIYKEAMAGAEELGITDIYLTKILRDYEGDVVLPEVDNSIWREHFVLEFNSVTDDIPVELYHYER